MMNDTDLIELLADKAIGYLIEYGRNPDIGMGLSYDMAIDLAEHDIKVEAARWNAMLALQLDINDNMKSAARCIIAQHRSML